MKMATTDIRVPHGKLALEFGGNRLPLAVLNSHRGYYLGTYDDCGTVSRESAEYWPTEDRAEVALASGESTQRWEDQTSELQSLMRMSSAAFNLKKKNNNKHNN